MRLFFAVDLPDRLADEVAAVQDRLRDAEGLRFTDPEQAHLTLKFLGDVDSDRIEELETAANEAISNAEVEREDGTVEPVEPFEAEVGGLGVFPSIEYISVVWAGFRRGEAELTALHEALEVETTALGFEPDDHEFTPHVTLARMDDARGKEIVQEVVRETDPTIGRFRVEDVRLTESTLTPEGPEHDTVTRFELS
ncbi:RNA 2',3'-cyclic phosphodiesterase [Halalkaliarchaeum sp. AArc-GB]|uniref:RNA 2',3'-cyclic phosphodiesterase n=1 Tax=Halalkaliarchaeum sp. AArc-GB TaxID=3074078 RepID=UPI0028576AD7|nr:RNA 2',3'-cyclic phosphodiesterase [Halalkaliarchaeum sp. AArc-GB]MDR5674535.1 RNA 2',3'-cyclic phosphodiesterase [Halalkaliarchaeum sp. AArc-GB]